MVRKKPDNWQEIAEIFKLRFNEDRKDVDLMHIGNMDEVPMCFDMPGNHTVDEIGSQDVRLATTGHEKMCFTVVLCVTADGSRCTPMVIFKRKTIPTEIFPSGIIVQANQRGWMTSDIFEIWFNNVWKNRKGTFFQKPNTIKNILICDSARSHITEDSKKILLKHLTKMVVIPGGMTSILQPLDISVNKSFKSKIRLK